MSLQTSLLALAGATFLFGSIGCSTHRRTEDTEALRSPPNEASRSAALDRIRHPRPPVSNGHHVRDFLHDQPLQGASVDASNPFPDFWWIGAYSTDTSAIPNTGVQFSTQVVNTPAGATGGCFNVWTSDTLDNDMWGQVGFSACDEAGEPEYDSTAFYQIWNLAVGNGGELLVAANSSELTVGLHNFSMYVDSGTTWAFAVDGNVFGVYDMKSATADVKEGVSTLCEEGDGIDAAFVPPVLQMPITMEVRSSTGLTWGPADQAQVFNTAKLSGVVGHLQMPALANDQIIVGGSTPAFDAGTLLWNGTSTEGGLPTTSDAGPSSPPYVAVSCPVAGVTLGGTVVVQATASAAAGVAEVEFAADGKSLCTVSSPPFECAWDTSSLANGPYYVVAQVVDTQDNATWEYVVVNVDHTAGNPCPAVAADAGPEDAGMTGTDGAPSDAGTADGAIADASAPDAGARDASSDAMPVAVDAATMDAAVMADATTSDAESGEGDSAGTGSGSSSGCGCRVATSDSGSPNAAWAIGLLGVAIAIGRRRRPMVD